VQTITIKRACVAVVDCPHSTPEWTETGALVFRSNNIRKGRLDLTSKSYTTEAEFVSRSELWQWARKY
jgi:type I restriction enzyme S subunit